MLNRWQLATGESGLGLLGMWNTEAKGGWGLDPQDPRSFQAEITKVIRVALLLKHWHFFVDGQAALLALDSTMFSSQLVRERIQSLEELAIHNKVILWWVKAHVGYELNKELCVGGAPKRE